MYGRAEYLEIEKPDRIVYTQQFCDENEKVSRHPMSPTWPETMLTTVKLSEEGPDRTRVTVTWEPHGGTTPEEIETFIKAKGGMTAKAGSEIYLMSCDVRIYQTTRRQSGLRFENASPWKGSTLRRTSPYPISFLKPPVGYRALALTGLRVLQVSTLLFVSQFKESEILLKQVRDLVGSHNG